MPYPFDEEIVGVAPGWKPPVGGVSLEATGGVNPAGAGYQQALAQGLRAQGSPLASANRESSAQQGGLMPWLQAPKTWDFGAGGAPSSKPSAWGEPESAAGDRARWAAYQQKLADDAAAAQAAAAAKAAALAAAQQQAQQQQSYFGGDAPSGDGSGGPGDASGGGDGGSW